MLHYWPDVLLLADLYRIICYLLCTDHWTSSPTDLFINSIRSGLELYKANKLLLLDTTIIISRFVKHVCFLGFKTNKPDNAHFIHYLYNLKTIIIICHNNNHYIFDLYKHNWYHYYLYKHNNHCQAQFKFSTSSVQFELRLSLKSGNYHPNPQPHPPTPTRESRDTASSGLPRALKFGMEAFFNQSRSTS